MSMNCIFGFSLFLLLLVALNIYFFYILSTEHKPATFKLPIVKSDPIPPVIREINDFLNRLPSQYHNKNSKFLPVQKSLISSFNSSGTNSKSVWQTVENWADEESLFPYKDGAAGEILQAMRSSQIALADNAPKGTQLKLLLLLQGKQKLYFKPKRYNVSDVIRGNIYAGYDRHNSEVFTYYLAMVLNYKWVAPSVIRRIHFNQDILAHAAAGLKRTMVKNDKGLVCIYGKCYYCKVNETVCPDNKGEIEGAAILYLDKQFKVNKSPWRRSYNNMKMEWENDFDFCKKVSMMLSTKRILNLIDISIIDFLIQNGDRHRYEVYKNKIILLDNGKGLGNPMLDEIDILAPLYQCCMISSSTWQTLELVSGGSLTETIKLLASFQGEKLTTDDHYRAVERRLLKVYATVKYCVAKHGSAKVFKNIDGI
ncbi:glycosaminoglycan xylosylkinase homolog isoform X1 [Helicoverpa zea]|uniref:glycosaminoglycan xylosylkinase homolog isoform X1 n=2 Tax=Helicoverpa zea TaxID=7113 RepID=UPI001F56C124|nr:glycosaminoglycan xylosylkinase homolog isoform X1 [Helicoverpa zea]